MGRLKTHKPYDHKISPVASSTINSLNYILLIVNNNGFRSRASGSYKNEYFRVSPVSKAALFVEGRGVWFGFRTASPLAFVCFKRPHG